MPHYALPRRPPKRRTCNCRIAAVHIFLRTGRMSSCAPGRTSVGATLGPNFQIASAQHSPCFFTGAVLFADFREWNGGASKAVVT